MTQDRGARAAAAEHAVLTRHLRTLWGLPATRLGVVSWPAAPSHRVFLRWHYWWQAHLLDCAVDAWLRSPDAARARTVRQIARAVRVRNLGRWTNDYYDDIAWLGLALDRARPLGVSQRGVHQAGTAVLDAWTPPDGGIPWRRQDRFFNAPANGPAAILLARTGFGSRAGRMADWLWANLLVEPTGLIADGFHPGQPLQPTFYSYNQGVVLGAELVAGTDRRRIHRLVAAVATEMAVGGVLTGHGGGNGGLFTGILTRYLALTARQLPGTDPADRRTRALAAELVLTSADAAWAHRAAAPGGPLFGPDWSRPAGVPGRAGVGRSRGATVETSAQPERDLSVQLSAWMLLEAAATLPDPG